MIKIKSLIVSGLILCGITARAQTTFDLFSQCQQQVVLACTNLAAGTYVGNPFDVSRYGGVACIFLTGVSNGVAGDLSITVYSATSPTQASWVPISNACIGQWTATIITNLSQVGDVGTTNYINSIKTPYTSRASVTTISNTITCIGIPVRDNNRYWAIGVTNAGSSVRSIGAVMIGRNMQAD